MNRFKIFFLVLGDVVALYLSLFVALTIRYGGNFYEQFIDLNVAPFTIVFAFWLLIFYIAGLYDLRRLRNTIDFLKTLSLSLFLNAIFAILLFYFVPSLGIAPKTNLFIFIVIFTIVELLWRRAFNRLTSTGEAPNRAILIGDGSVATDITGTIGENPQLGYAIMEHINEDLAAHDPETLKKSIERTHANIIAVPRHMKREQKLVEVLYELFGKGILIIDLANFYERVLRKVPLADLEETWFLENIENAGRYYDSLKNAGEFIFAIVVGVVLSPIEVLIALLVKITSPGDIIYRQVRTGQNGASFMLYKFRTMQSDAEKNGAQWSSGTTDARVTPLGKVLRASHLDELPQLWNVIRGDISFVGPRPERPEFVEKLKNQIPYYEVRLLVKPGVTGWAQINHRADRDLTDVAQKLQYDIYYLKNRSLVLDIAIILKTIKSFFVNPE